MSDHISFDVLSSESPESLETRELRKLEVYFPKCIYQDFCPGPMVLTLDQLDEKLKQCSERFNACKDAKEKVLIAGELQVWTGLYRQLGVDTLCSEMDGESNPKIYIEH